MKNQMKHLVAYTSRASSSSPSSSELGSGEVFLIVETEAAFADPAGFFPGFP